MTYFDPTNPLFLSRDASFNGVAVKIDEDIMNFVEQYTTLLLTMQGLIYEAGAAEDYGQSLAESYVKNLKEIIHATQPND